MSRDPDSPRTIRYDRAAERSLEELRDELEREPTDDEIEDRIREYDQES